VTSQIEPFGGGTPIERREKRLRAFYVRRRKRARETRAALKAEKAKAGKGKGCSLNRKANNDKKEK